MSSENDAVASPQVLFIQGSAIPPTNGSSIPPFRTSRPGMTAARTPAYRIPAPAAMVIPVTSSASARPNRRRPDGRLPEKRSGLCGKVRFLIMGASTTGTTAPGAHASATGRRDTATEFMSGSGRAGASGRCALAKADRGGGDQVPTRPERTSNRRTPAYPAGPRRDNCMRWQFG